MRKRPAFVLVKLLACRVTLPQQIIGCPLLVQSNKEVDEATERKDVSLATNQAIRCQFWRGESQIWNEAEITHSCQKIKMNLDWFCRLKGLNKAESAEF